MVLLVAVVVVVVVVVIVVAKRVKITIRNIMKVIDQIDV